MTPDTALSAKMTTYADAQGFPPNHEMRTAATRFDEATKGFYATPQTCAVAVFFGRWAKARRIWCEHTGENLT